jgi:hypothetical protein
MDRLNPSAVNIIVSFNHEGDLPASGNVEIGVYAGIEYAGKVFHYYYYNEETGSLE